MRSHRSATQLQVIYSVLYLIRFTSTMFLFYSNLSETPQVIRNHLLLHNMIHPLLHTKNGPGRSVIFALCQIFIRALSRHLNSTLHASSSNSYLLRRRKQGSHPGIRVNLRQQKKLLCRCRLPMEFILILNVIDCADIGIAFSDSTLGIYIHIADPLLGSI